MQRPSLTAIILTLNEEIHLQRCIDSIKVVCESIIVVDSYSNDATEQIALRNNARFVQNNWVNYSIQFNWALKNLDIKTDWVLRIDADEYLTNELQSEISSNLSNLKEPINGVVLPLRRIFMGKHIKYGTGNIKLLRLFRNGKAESELRWMDEHIKLIEGEIIYFKGEFADHNLNSISWWTKKHVGYALREAIEMLDIEFGILQSDKGRGSLSPQASNKRRLKVKYAKQPLFIRAFIYFVYRYIIRLGFLDGREGFLWHFLQGWWYRTIVDIKIYEIKRNCGLDKSTIKSYLSEHYDIAI